MFKISHSKLKAWRRCHRLYHYKYELHLEPKAKKRTLLFGTIGHEMIEAEANGQDPWKVLKKYEGQYAKLFREQREEYGDIIGDMARLMRGYFSYWAKAMPVKWIEIKGKRAEHEFEVEVAKGVVIKGKVDGFAVTVKNGLTWVNEHKFPKQMRQDDMESLTNVQTALYTHPKILDSLGIKKADGVMWTFTKQKGPTLPKLNKDGSLPKGDIDTLPEVFEEFMKANKLTKDKDALKKLKGLAGKHNDFFRRVTIPIKPVVSDQLMREAISTAGEMQELQGSKDRTISRDCGWCEFQPLCRAELFGHDADFVRKHKYQISKHHLEHSRDEN